jgi:hypothetical protein
MTYSPPTLADLHTKLARDLRDTVEHTIFPTDQLTDYINDAIADINEAKPIETTLDITDPVNQTGLSLQYIWKVEAVRQDGYGQNVLPPNNDETNWQNGWTYFNHTLTLPQATQRTLETGFTDDTLILRVHGYRPRDPLIDDDDVAEFDLQDEQAVRRFATARGFKALVGTRSLFQQWQTEANNTDVSPTQLEQMRNDAESEWARQRRRMFMIRRPAVGW